MPLLAARTGVGEEARGLQLAAIDRLEKYGREKTAAWLAQEAKGVLDAGQIERTIAIGAIRSLDAARQAAIDVPEAGAGVEALAQTLAALDAMGLAGYVDVDLGIVRGLAYYTGTVFELFDAGKTLRAICGGGRYDKLAGALGGVDLPAVGFGFGDVVLGELLKDRGLVPRPESSIDVFIAAVTGDDVPHMLALAHELRDAGLRVEYALGAQAVGKQVKLADSRNARFAIVIGPDDRARGEVMVKDLRAKTQRGVVRAECRASLEGGIAECRMTNAE